MPAPTYNLIRDYSPTDNPDATSTAPFWVLAVAPLGQPLSYSRQRKGSLSQDSSQGARLRGGKVILVTGDCVQLAVQGSKDSHIKTLAAVLVQSNRNYLIDLKAGDWVMAWMVNTESKARDVVDRIKRGKACNGFRDGLKFVGRAKSLRKMMRIEGEGGTKSSRYQLQAAGFSELDTQIFYDNYLATNDVQSDRIGQWLARVGVDLDEIFRTDQAGDQDDNVGLLIPTLVELFLGRGPSSNGTNDAGSTPDQVQAASWDTQKSREAPFAYLVPKEVGQLLGRESRDASKAGGILAYADLMELLYGVQSYQNSGSTDYSAFTPYISDGESSAQQRSTGTKMMGSFLPLMPFFLNQPMWNTLEQFLNPVINEMYTCMRVNEDGKVVPTVVLRQIPFTSPALANKFKNQNQQQAEEASGELPTGSSGDSKSPPPYTEYYSLPRWKIHPTLVRSLDLGWSDATHFNFVHVYGQDSAVANNISITQQIALNPPVRDDIDIQRSGLRSYMATVACRLRDSVGETPGTWMELIADWAMGSQYTLNGTMELLGVEAPICEGDNVEFDGLIFHIEGVAHACRIDPSDGTKSFSTTLTLSHGLRTDDPDKLPKSGDLIDNESDDGVVMFPGFYGGDQRALDPGLTVDDDQSDLTSDPPKDSSPQQGKPGGGEGGNSPPGTGVA